MAARRFKPRSPRFAGDAIGYTLGEVLAVCPFRSVVGLPGTDLLGGPPNFAIAADLPDRGDPAPELLAEMVATIQAGGTVLIMAHESAARDHMKALVVAATPHPRGARMSAGKAASAVVEAVRLLRTGRTAGLVEVRSPHHGQRALRMPVREMADGTLAIGRPGQQDAQGAAWRQAVEVLWAAS